MPCLEDMFDKETILTDVIIYLGENEPSPMEYLTTKGRINEEAGKKAYFLNA